MPSDAMTETPPTPPTESPQPRSEVASTRSVWIVVALILVSACTIGALGFHFFRRSAQLVAAVGPRAAAPAPPPAAPLVSVPEAEGALQASVPADFWALFGGQDVLRRAVASVELASKGQTPFHLFAAARPTGPFAVVERDGKSFIAAESYSRFDVPVKTFTQLDGAKLGALYARARPAIDQLYAEIARPGARFDDALKKAITPLSALALPSGDIEVVEKGGSWAFADPALEAHTPLEKALLRLGPTHGAVVQTLLGDFARQAFPPAP